MTSVSITKEQHDRLTVLALHWQMKQRDVVRLALEEGLNLFDQVLSSSPNWKPSE